MDRSLAHIERIAWVKPIEKADNIEQIGILGWTLFAKKGDFQQGDLCCFFEIDSLLKEAEWCKFLEPKHYKVKLYKLNKFNVYSEGLAIPVKQIPELADKMWNVGDDVTELLGVTYSVFEDNIRKRKENPDAKYNRMAGRHKNLAKYHWFRWLMKRQWGKELLFFFLGSTYDNNYQFPTHFEFIHKSDETRCENIDQEKLFSDKSEYRCTLKIDGTSATYILERKGFWHQEFYVCSRNVRMLDENQKCYHQTNVYWEAEKKYMIRDFLEALLERHRDWKYVCIQGEIAGEGVQGNPHKLTGLNFFGFNLIDSVNGRWDSVKARNLCKEYNIPWVPIVNEHYVLPDDMETLKLQADGPCDLPGSSGLREGFVYRNVLNPNISFKNVSRKYIIKKGE